MSTAGETSLSTLFASLNPILSPSIFVFATLPPNTPTPSTLTTQMTFVESEGTTLITTKDVASQHDLEYTFECRMITLNVHSSLDAVGFLAYITNELKELGMGVNPVSGYFHDHLFVPVGREEEAMACLRGIRERYTKPKVPEYWAQCPITGIKF